MFVALLLLFVAAMLVAVIAGIISGVKQSIPQAKESPPPPVEALDSQNLPSTLSTAEREHILKIAKHWGTRYVTQADMRRYAIWDVSEGFSEMPGWDIWDISVHESPGQYERMSRGALDGKISIICYDPKYQLAKIMGSSGIYLTSCNRCSCPDYRKRRLPCKHMYSLMMELNGDPTQRISDPAHKSLYGMTFALAGHLPRKTKTTSGIREQIIELGGNWSDDISFDSTAAIIGTDPSIARVTRAKSFDMEILSPEAIHDLFT